MVLQKILLFQLKKKNYWNYNSLSAKDPVSINLCTQLELQNAIDKADRRIKRETKKREKEKSIEK